MTSFAVQYPLLKVLLGTEWTNLSKRQKIMLLVQLKLQVQLQQHLQQQFSLYQKLLALWETRRHTKIQLGIV